MKTVTFVRHGKSSWDYQVGDKDRPLKERGVNDAKLVSEEFKSLNSNIDYVYSSPANRALHTSMIFTRVLEYNLDKFKVHTSLYDFSGETVLQFLKNLNNEQGSVMIFGHNYAFTTLVNTLGDTYIENVPTAGLVQVKFDVARWGEILKGTTIKIIFPKELR